MSNFFLLNKAIDLADIEPFLLGMEELNAVSREPGDRFERHESVWDLPVWESLYTQLGQRESLVLAYVETLASAPANFLDEAEHDRGYPGGQNAFLGIDFTGTTISAERQITGEISCWNFRQSVLWDTLDARNFWERREQLYPNLVLCGEVEAQVSGIGQKELGQIDERLRELNKAAKAWQKGDFNWQEVNLKYALRISPESKSTMGDNTLKNMRKFSTPSGKKEIFELHIKTGDKRFHFYPDNATQKIYVGYIGPHLPTSTFS